MFDEPESDDADQPTERATSPADMAKEKADEFRMHAELCAVFEGTRKFDSNILPKLDQARARELQRAIGRLEKARPADSPVLPDASVDEATRALQPGDLSTNDYHIHRRPGEVMIVRWLAGAEVEAFYDRLQAHFDAALNAYREDERNSNQWKADARTLQYLEALDKIELKMSDRYLRAMIRQHGIFVLSTQAADEMDILFLADQVMSVTPQELVGSSSAPPTEPSERDRAWFFKLFSLRGVVEGVERMCLFVYMQKTEDGW